MKKFVLIGICLALTACGTAPAPTAEPEYKNNTKVTYLIGTDSYKFCDEGRAVYIYDGVKSGGLGIVENAKECLRSSENNVE